MRIPGLKRTTTGRIVYDRKKHVFNGRDMTRIVITVNNNNTGNILNWRAVYKIASSHYVDEINDPSVMMPIQSDKELLEILKAFDSFLAAVVPFLSGVPVFGPFLELVYTIYKKVRAYYGY